MVRKANKKASGDAVKIAEEVATGGTTVATATTEVTADVVATGGTFPTIKGDVLGYAGVHNNDDGRGFSTNNNTGRVFKIMATGIEVALAGVIKVFANIDGNGKQRVGFNLSLTDEAGETLEGQMKPLLEAFAHTHQRAMLTALGVAYTNNARVIADKEYCEYHSLKQPPTLDTELKVCTRCGRVVSELIAYLGGYCCVFASVGSDVGLTGVRL